MNFKNKKASKQANEQKKTPPCTNLKPVHRNKAISYWYTRISSLISSLVTGCTRHCPAVLSQPNNSSRRGKWKQETCKVIRNTTAKAGRGAQVPSKGSLKKCFRVKGSLNVHVHVHVQRICACWEGVGNEVDTRVVETSHAALSIHGKTPVSPSGIHTSRQQCSGAIETKPEHT